MDKIKDIIRKEYDSHKSGYVTIAIESLKQSGLMGEKEHITIKNIVDAEIQRYEKEYFEKYKHMIGESKYESPATILAYMYMIGFRSKYTDSYKKIQKELQRIDSSELKSHRSLVKKAELSDHLLSKIKLYRLAITFRFDKIISDKLHKLEEEFELEQILEDEKQFSMGIIHRKKASPIKIYLDPSNRNTLVMEQDQETKKGIKMVKSFASIPPSLESTDIYWIGGRTSTAKGYEHNTEALIIMRDWVDTIRIYHRGTLILENYHEEELKLYLETIK